MNTSIYLYLLIFLLLKRSKQWPPHASLDWSGAAPDPAIGPDTAKANGKPFRSAMTRLVVDGFDGLSCGSTRYLRHRETTRSEINSVAPGQCHRQNRPSPVGTPQATAFHRTRREAVLNSSK